MGAKIFQNRYLYLQTELPIFSIMGKRFPSIGKCRDVSISITGRFICFTNNSSLFPILLDIFRPYPDEVSKFLLANWVSGVCYPHEIFISQDRDNVTIFRSCLSRDFSSVINISLVVDTWGLEANEIFKFSFFMKKWKCFNLSRDSLRNGPINNRAVLFINNALTPNKCKPLTETVFT